MTPTGDLRPEEIDAQSHDPDATFEGPASVVNPPAPETFEQAATRTIGHLDAADVHLRNLSADDCEAFASAVSAARLAIGAARCIVRRQQRSSSR